MKTTLASIAFAAAALCIALGATICRAADQDPKVTKIVTVPDSDEQRIADLVLANHILADQGVLDAYGHVSVRSVSNPKHFFLAWAQAPELVTREDILEFDLDGKPIGSTTRSLYAERFIHSEIFRARPDVQSVVHAHSTAVIPFGVTGAVLRPVLHMAAFLPQAVPVFEIRRVPGSDNRMLVDDASIGAALARVLGDGCVALMRGHGMVAVGPSVRHATFRAVYTQVDAQIELEALKLGPVVALNTAEAAKADAMLEGNLMTPGARPWQLWANHAEAQRQKAIATAP
jgi:ribulose-5-phosphate 4-epimerase/fuculose-1-phosphate aldolase